MRDLLNKILINFLRKSNRLLKNVNKTKNKF